MARRRLCAVPPFNPRTPETCVESGCDFPLAFHVLTPGAIASTETSVDIDIFHCMHGHSNELLLEETAKKPGLKLGGKLRPYTGCSKAKRYCKPIPNSTKFRAAE